MGTALEKEVNKSLEKTLVCLLRYKKKVLGLTSCQSHGSYAFLQPLTGNCSKL